MYAAVGLLRKKPGVDAEEFHRWWLDKHVPIAKTLPGVRRYYTYPIDQTYDPVHGGWNDDTPWQGVAILWFDDAEAAAACFASPTGEHDREHFHTMVHESLILAGGAIEQIGPDGQR